MKKLIYVLFIGLLLSAATGTDFAQEKTALAKMVKSDDKENKDSETKKDSANKEISASTSQTTSESKCETCRWFEPTAASFSIRYRTTTDTGNVRNLNQAQQRIVLGGKFKFDK